MKLSNTIIKLIIVVIIFVVCLGIIYIFQYISPDSGIVIDKNITSYKNSLEFKVLVKSEKYNIPLWIEVTENYYNELSINDVYNKNENSKMYSYWIENNNN